MIRKRYLLIICFLVVASFLSGCFGKKDPIPSAKTGSLKVSITIPNELVPVQSKGTLDGITLSKVDFTITNGKKTFTKTGLVAGDTVTTAFPNLQPGDWTIDVVAKEVVDSTEYEVFKGQGTGSVAVDKITSVDVKMKLVNGSLYLQLNIPEDFTEAKKVKIILADKISTPIVREYSIDELSTTVIFDNLTTTAWEVKVEAFDETNEICADSAEIIDIKPGRAVSASASFNLGKIEIKPTWNMPPKKPTNLQARVIENGVKLTWDASTSEIAGYSVARSTSIDGKKIMLNNNIITSLEFTDTTVYKGENYYYWVAAYCQDGLYSGWSDPVEVDSMQLELGELVYLAEFDSPDSSDVNWIGLSGQWSIVSGVLVNEDLESCNTNIYQELEQPNGFIYVYEYKVTYEDKNDKVWSPCTGLHFMSNDATAKNRGDSYLFFNDAHEVQLYKTFDTTDSRITRVLSKSTCPAQVGQTKVFRIKYNTVSGNIQVYCDGLRVIEWTDIEPLKDGKFISIRTNGAKASFDYVKVYKVKAE